MAKKKMEEMGCHCCPNKGFLMFMGIIAILLGLILWFGYLTLSQTIAVVLVLKGIQKLFYSCNK
jgi:uncharacterized membrane protein HdeD (DUF308 family)